MEYVYIYGDPGRLYLNVTNRCTNRCSFCVRNYSRGLGGAVLWGGAEPDLSQLQKAVLQRGPLEKIVEFIWCGFGEPTYRLDLITAASPWLRGHGAKIRLNTNGHACLIHGQDVLEELSRAVDEVSVSLNAPDPGRYLELSLPDLRSIRDSGCAGLTPEDFWESTLDFLKRAPAFFERVQASVVGFALTEEEIEQCRALVHSLGVGNFRVR